MGKHQIFYFLSQNLRVFFMPYIRNKTKFQYFLSVQYTFFKSGQYQEILQNKNLQRNFFLLQTFFQLIQKPNPTIQIKQMNNQNSFLNKKTNPQLLIQDQNTLIDKKIFQNFKQMIFKFQNFKHEVLSQFNDMISWLKLTYQENYNMKIIQMEQRYNRKMSQQEEQIKSLKDFAQAIQKVKQSFKIEPLPEIPLGQVQKIEPQIEILGDNSNLSPNKNIEQDLKIIEQKQYMSSFKPYQRANQVIQQKQNHSPNIPLNIFTQPTKYLIRKKNYNLLQVRFNPNQTLIKYLCLQYVECVCQGSQYIVSNIFSQQDIKKLNQYKLEHIESIHLREKQISDEMFMAIAKGLDTRNIRSLLIDDNLITDAWPLKFFHLQEFVELDISWNPLNQKSAEFLAEFLFQKLVYFSISFERGKNQALWKILLKNGMKNFPNLQVIDIYYSKQLSPQMKHYICQALKELQNTRISNKRSVIKINWYESKQQWNKLYGTKLTVQKKINKQWRDKYNYKAIEADQNSLKLKDEKQQMIIEEIQRKILWKSKINNIRPKQKTIKKKSKKVKRKITLLSEIKELNSQYSSNKDEGNKSSQQEFSI